MEHVEVFARGNEKNQVTAPQTGRKPGEFPFWHTLDPSPSGRKAWNDVQHPLSADDRNGPRQHQPDYTFAHIVANPAGHVMVSPYPFDTPSLVANFSQPFDKAIGARSAGKCKNCFDICDAVQSAEGSREHLRCVRRANQRIRLIWLSQKFARDDFDPIAGAMLIAYFQDNPLYPSPGESSWLRVLHPKCHDVLTALWRLEHKGESPGVVKIGPLARMTKRPIRKSVVGFDDR